MMYMMVTMTTTVMHTDILVKCKLAIAPILNELRAIIILLYRLLEAAKTLIFFVTNLTVYQNTLQCV